MTTDEIKALIDAMAASDLAEMEFAKDGWTLRLRRGLPRPDPAAAPGRPRRPVREVAPRPTDPSSGEVRSPLFGIVYLGASPDAPPFASVGQRVEAGAVLCTVEAMKTFHEVRAERTGIVEAVLVATGDEVDAGQPLVRLG